MSSFPSQILCLFLHSAPWRVGDRVATFLFLGCSFFFLRSSFPSLSCLTLSPFLGCKVGVRYSLWLVGPLVRFVLWAQFTSFPVWPDFIFFLLFNKLFYSSQKSFSDNGHEWVVVVEWLKMLIRTNVILSEIYICWDASRGHTAKASALLHFKRRKIFLTLPPKPFFLSLVLGSLQFWISYIFSTFFFKLFSLFFFSFSRLRTGSYNLLLIFLRPSPSS